MSSICTSTLQGKGNQTTSIFSKTTIGRSLVWYSWSCQLKSWLLCEIKLSFLKKSLINIHSPLIKIPILICLVIRKSMIMLKIILLEQTMRHRQINCNNNYKEFFNYAIFFSKMVLKLTQYSCVFQEMARTYSSKT